MIHQVTVVTPAAETSLTTLTRLKAELNITDTASDAILTAKIEEASSDIAVRVAPLLRREELSETIRWGGRHSYCGLDSLYLSRAPIVSIDSVTIDGSLVDPGDYYYTDDAEHWGGAVYRLMAGYAMPWLFVQSVVVVYTAGYLLPGESGRNLPPVLEAACLELVSAYWSSRGRDPALKAEEDYHVARFEYWVGAVGADGDLPPSVMAKISSFLKTPALA